MSTAEKNQGPKITQMVLYNNAGAIIPGIIYAVSVPSDGRVSLLSLDAAGATSRTNVVYDPNLGASKWAYQDSQ